LALCLVVVGNVECLSGGAVCVTAVSTLTTATSVVGETDRGLEGMAKRRDSCLSEVLSEYSALNGLRVNERNINGGDAAVDEGQLDDSTADTLKVASSSVQPSNGGTEGSVGGVVTVGQMVEVLGDDGLKEIA